MLTMQPPSKMQIQADEMRFKAERERTEKVQDQLKEVKIQCNDLVNKNNILRTKIGYLTREVKERDKLMQNFVLNNESEAKVQEKCVITSYKSKLDSVKRKLEQTKKLNTNLKQENSTLKENEQLLNAKL